VQLSGAERSSCLNDPDASGNGFCYIDSEQNLGSPTLVEHCPADEKRQVRFVAESGVETPLSGAIVLLACDPG
jgi:hypothetical protein